MDDFNFNRLLESVKETKHIMDGKKEPSRSFFISEPNPKEIRTKMALTQNKFAALMNISVHTLRNWEQGRRQPEGPARVLLNVANNHPEVLKELPTKIDWIDIIETQIINDGSTDKTVKVAKKYWVDHIVEYIWNKWLWYAFKTAMIH